MLKPIFAPKVSRHLSHPPLACRQSGSIEEQDCLPQSMKDWLQDDKWVWKGQFNNWNLFTHHSHHMAVISGRFSLTQYISQIQSRQFVQWFKQACRMKFHEDGCVPASPVLAVAGAMQHYIVLGECTHIQRDHKRNEVESVSQRMISIIIGTISYKPDLEIIFISK